MRNDFNIDEYILKLNQSDSISSCDSVPLPELPEKYNYIFISYAHKDYKQVYADLAVMYRAGVRFWYDKGLVAGKDWSAEAKRIIESPRCVGVIFFLSENLFLSESVNKEIDIVTGCEGKNYFCVNLSDLSPGRILRSIMRMDDEVLDRAGFHMERVSVLSNAFSDSMTYLRFADLGHRKDLIEQIAMQFNVMETAEQRRGYLIDQNTGKKIEITTDSFVVGRTERKCHYCIEDDVRVSSVHFTLSTDGGRNLIMDFGSMNGTFLNGEQLAGMMPVPIRHEDVITFANQKFKFMLT